MDVTNVTQSDRSVVDTIFDESNHHEAADNRAEVGEGASGSMEGLANQPNDSITPTEEGKPLLERVCEVVQLAGKELSEDERLHITNSTAPFSSNCSVLLRYLC